MSVRTHQWPVVIHLCPAQPCCGFSDKARFAGAQATDGAETSCTDCSTRFTYIKPQASARDRYVGESKGILSGKG